MEDIYLTYKKAIKTKYEQEKGGGNRSFPIHPTPARLRDLTLHIFRGTTDSNDLKTFEHFMGFPYHSNNNQKIKTKIDAFRPLINFLKGQSDLANPQAVEMLALLLDFTPRPYNDFRIKFLTGKKELKELEDVVQTEGIKQTEIESVKETEKEDGTEEDTTEIESVKETEEVRQIEKPKVNDQMKNNYKRKSKVFIGVGLGIIALGSSVFYNVKFSIQKECMQWATDRYVAIDCSIEKPISLYNPSVTKLVPVDVSIIEKFRKIEVDSNTAFFNAKGEPMVWYCKNRWGKLEYFNQPGLHPETEETLRKITPHIINKYVKNKIPLEK